MYIMYTFLFNVHICIINVKSKITKIKIMVKNENHK